jgi:serine protease Do
MKSSYFFFRLMGLVAAIGLSLSINAAKLPDFTELVEKTGDAVVNIEAHTEAQMPATVIPVDPYHRRVIPARPQDRVSVGTGFIISPDGFVLTNRHVVHGATRILVRLPDHRELTAELVGEDEPSDIALLKLDAENLPTLKMGDSDKLKIGEWVMAIGSPLSFEHSVTKGIVSAKGRSMRGQQYVPYIQTDVPINRGNSGGPLINMDGEVVGINTLILSNTGGYMGLSFSIPIEVAASVAEQLKQHGRVERGLLGVGIEPVTQKMADYLKMKTPHGALVNHVAKGSAADKAGIKVQDVIVQLDDEKIDTASDLPPLVGERAPGTSVVLVVYRDGREKQLTATLDSVTGSGSQSAAGFTPANLGFSVANLDARQRQESGLSGGVVVREVKNPQVQRSGLREGDIILKVGKQPIDNVKQFSRRIRQLAAGEPLVMLINRNGANRFIVIER